MTSQEPIPFGAVLERVPTAGGQWAATAPPPARRSVWGTLAPLLLVAALAVGGWYGYTNWYQPNAALSGAVKAYVGGSGVPYLSPVTGIGGDFAGAPVEVAVPGGAASAFTGDGFTMVVAAVAAPATEADAVAMVEALAANDSVRVGSAAAGGFVYAVAVGAGDGHNADALFKRFTKTLRLPGGVTL